MKITYPIPSSTPLSALASINITDAKFKANPFPFYARLRAEAPVFPVTVRGGQRAWLVTHYDDVLAVLKNDQHFVKDPKNAMTFEQLKKAPKIPPMFRALERNMLSLDAGDHDRLKALVHKAFTPRMIEQMRDQTQAVTDAALDNFQRKGSMDLIADFALPVPLTIIGRILGVPESDNHRFNSWTRAFIEIGGGGNPLFLIPSMLAFMGYLKKLIKERRIRPRDDLISGLVKAQEGNDQLTDDEVLAMIFLLLSAGHETTVNLIGSGALALLEHPDQIIKLRDQPELIKPAVEELVRYVVPAEMTTQRYATKDINIAGITIPRGEMVLGVLASANRDPKHFENPDVVNIARENNKHLSFGQGMHYCLGAPLSRLEAQIALSTLFRRVPNLRVSIAPEQIRWRSGFIVRGLESLPVSF